MLCKQTWILEELLNWYYTKVEQQLMNGNNPESYLCFKCVIRSISLLGMEESYSYPPLIPVQMELTISTDPVLPTLQNHFPFWLN